MHWDSHLATGKMNHFGALNCKIGTIEKEIPPVLFNGNAGVGRYGSQYFISFGHDRLGAGDEYARP